EYDEMYDQAVAIVTETQQASISMIQRRLRVGYNRAARMIEQMEREGVVGPPDGARPREVYARKLEAENRAKDFVGVNFHSRGDHCNCAKLRHGEPKRRSDCRQPSEKLRCHRRFRCRLSPRDGGKNAQS